MTLAPAFHRLAPVFAATALLLMGCDDGESEATGVLIDEFAGAYHEATCQHIVTCNFAADMATCRSVIAQDPGVAQAVASARSGSLSYDAAAARTCIDTLTNHPCTGDTLVPKAVREACDKVFGKRRGEGEPCYHAAECQGLGAVCEGACDDRCCQGVCKLDQGFSKLGEACDMKPCTDGTYCAPGPSGATCVEKVGPGEACDDSPYACVEGYACDPGTNTCFKQADAGAQCNPELNADGCAGLADYCDVEQAKCIPMPSIGEPCVTNAVAANFCAGSIAFCGPDQICTSWPKEGEPCPQDFCLGGNLTGTTAALRCQGGTCVRVPATVACTEP
jgi:hypothetical protein